MRKLLLGVLVTFMAIPLYAQPKGLSVGADLINPAISSQYQLSKKAVVRMDIGFFLSENSSVSLNPQLLFHKANNSYELEEAGILMPYHGPGALFFISDGENFTTFEFVWGFELDLEEFPVELYADAGPSVRIDSPTALTLTSSFGVRYKF